MHQQIKPRTLTVSINGKNINIFSETNYEIKSLNIVYIGPKIFISNGINDQSFTIKDEVIKEEASSLKQWLFELIEKLEATHLLFNEILIYKQDLLKLKK